MIEDLVVLRALEDSEINFVYHSWLRSFRSDSTFYRTIPREIFFENHRKRLYRLLDRSHCIVANPRDHPDIIVAYIVWELPEEGNAVIHYIYVKSDYRKMGLARLLVDVAAAGRKITATHRTDTIRRDRIDIFNPYLMEIQDD